MWLTRHLPCRVRGIAPAIPNALLVQGAVCRNGLAQLG
ncbi:hypothetical protein AmDm5_2474 [Acetobacter malorum]|nr:hypothetical protein AmDm5_2474 [Acetobacter malorum]